MRSCYIPDGMGRAEHPPGAGPGMAALSCSKSPKLRCAWRESVSLSFTVYFSFFMELKGQDGNDSGNSEAFGCFSIGWELPL